MPTSVTLTLNQKFFNFAKKLKNYIPFKGLQVGYMTTPSITTVDFPSYPWQMTTAWSCFSPTISTHSTFLKGVSLKSPMMLIKKYRHPQVEIPYFVYISFLCYRSNPSRTDFMGSLLNWTHRNEYACMPILLPLQMSKER
jgi:hypothetical protein